MCPRVPARAHRGDCRRTTSIRRCDQPVRLDRSLRRPAEVPVLDDVHLLPAGMDADAEALDVIVPHHSVAVQAVTL